MNLNYLLPRLARRFLPEEIVRFLLLRGWIIRPGIETSRPKDAAERYLRVLADEKISLNGKTVLIFGYGGRFSLGISLLKAGAKQIILADKYAPPDDAYNLRLLPLNRAYLEEKAGRVTPRSEQMRLFEADIRLEEARAVLPPADIVISSSVYEHLEDVNGITQALASLTKADGIHIHYVDLRDHFFKYPFAMLSFSEKTWYGWLNPSSNHNRFRIWDYRRVFESCFERVDVKVLERDEAAFRAAQARIRPEFLSGDILQDSVTLILIVARMPKKG